MTYVPCQRREFAYSPRGEWSTPEHDLSSTLTELIKGIAGLENFTAVDVGCGGGRLTFHVAARGAWVVGIDRDPFQIDLARRRAEELHCTRVEFVCADAERIEYRDLVAGSPVHLVASNLCMSSAIMARAYRALAAEGLFLFEAFHLSQWREAGVPSRFAWNEEDMAACLRGFGFRIEYLGVEQDVVRFRGQEEFLQSGLVSGRLREKWQRDGRWAGLLDSFERGGCRLTVRGHLIVKAVKEGKP